MGNREEHLLKKIFDRQMDIHSGYLVYFDDVCMNEFVQGYVTNVGVSVGLGSASVTLTYAPQFKSIDTVDDFGAYIDSNDGVQNGTSLRIFAENVFSKKYHIIFDGIIKSRGVTRNPQGFTIVFTATDHMYWLSKSIAPITMPAEHQIWPGERIRWKGQGIFVDNLKSIAAVSAGQLVEKTISEYWHQILKKNLVNNSTVYSDSNSVAAFDDAINRVTIMGDINPELVKQQIIDLVITANAVFADTAYTALNNVTGKLLLEFFQDIDGVIKIKPPFWNEPVLKNYIIDPIMIKSGSEDTSWSSFYTRVIAQGGLSEWQGTDSKEAQGMFTPIGVYVGEYKNKTGGKWADYLNYSGFEVFGEAKDTTPAELIGGNLESACWSALSTYISNRAVICGIMANINRESSFSPNEGTGDGGLASGLFQWRDTVVVGGKNVAINRWGAVRATAENEVSVDMPPGACIPKEEVDPILIDIPFQIKYFLMDIGYIDQDGYYVPSVDGKDYYKSIGQKLKSISDTIDGAKEAAALICTDYEKPKDTDGESLNRKNTAGAYYNSYGKTSDKSGGTWSESNLVKYSKYKDSNLSLTTNFKVKDFACKGTQCGCDTVYVAEPVINILQSILDNNSGLKLVISSAYRCDAHNKNEGGSSTSLHRSGAAVDIHIAAGSTGFSIGGLYEELSKNRRNPKYMYGNWIIGELIYYKNKNFIHIGVNADNFAEDPWIDYSK